MTALITLLMSAGVVPAIVLPADCHPLDSESVLARDLAPLVPGFENLPQDSLIGYVDSAGTPRTLHGSDLEHIAKNRGVDLQGLQDVCVSRRMFVVPPERLIEAMRKTLGEDPTLKIEILDSSRQPVPTGEIVFPRNSVQQPATPEVTWRGSVQSGKGASYPIWARARITVTANRVIAATDLPMGKEIEPSQIRVESAEESPFDDAAVRSAEDATKMAARMSIPKGSVLRKSQLQQPLDVARGDVVRVEVFAGNAHLSLEAQAETSGVRGALITVRNPSTGRSFQGKVSGKGRVTVGGQPE
jgi:flagella basal body P-ring formation protein FlgA